MRMTLPASFRLWGGHKVGSEDYLQKDTVDHWLRFALPRASVSQLHAHLPPPLSSAHGLWHHWLLPESCPLLLSTAFYSTRPPGRTEAGTEWKLLPGPAPLEPKGVSGAQHRTLRPSTEAPTSFPLQVAHLQAYCLLCLPCCLHVFVWPSPTISLWLCSSPHLPFQPPLLLSHLKSTSFFFFWDYVVWLLQLEFLFVSWVMILFVLEIVQD